MKRLPSLQATSAPGRCVAGLPPPDSAVEMRRAHAQQLKLRASNVEPVAARPGPPHGRSRARLVPDQVRRSTGRLPVLQRRRHERRRSRAVCRGHERPSQRWLPSGNNGRNLLRCQQSLEPVTPAAGKRGRCQVAAYPGDIYRWGSQLAPVIDGGLWICRRPWSSLIDLGSRSSAANRVARWCALPVMLVGAGTGCAAVTRWPGLVRECFQACGDFR